MQRLRHLVVVVPGIGGSELTGEDGRADWSVTSSQLVGSFVRPARLDLEAAADLRPTALVSTFTSLGGLINVPGYEGLSDHLRRSFRAPVIHCHVAGVPVPADVDVLLFPYDFRRSVRDAAVALADAVTEALGDVLPSARLRRVIVIAHSMGGLVARYWLGPLGGASLCAALFTLGTPHRGTPKALDWLVNGAALGPTRIPWLTPVLRRWPSVYELLPQYPAVWDAKAGAALEMTHLGPDLLVARPKLRRYESTFADLAAAGRRTHEDIAAAWAEIDDLPVVPFFGRGHPTTNRLELTTRGRLVASKEDPDWRGNVGWRGDGTVPVIAAIPRELSDVRAPWRGVADRHMDFASTAAVLDVLTSFTGDALPTRGERPHRPWLGLDVEDAVAAGDPVPIGVVLQPDGTQAGAVYVSVRPLGVPVPPMPVEKLQERGGEWRATLPPLAAGRHRLTVEAHDVAGPGTVFAEADVVALDLEEGPGT